MIYILSYLLAFLCIYFFYLCTVILQTKRYDKFKTSGQVMYFVKRYHFDMDKIDMKKFTNVIGFTNSFIVATAFMATWLVDSLILQFVIAFVVLIPLMLVCYHFIGIYYEKGLRK